MSAWAFLSCQSFRHHWAYIENVRIINNFEFILIVHLTKWLIHCFSFIHVQYVIFNLRPHRQLGFSFTHAFGRTFGHQSDFERWPAFLFISLERLMATTATLTTASWCRRRRRRRRRRLRSSSGCVDSWMIPGFLDAWMSGRLVQDVWTVGSLGLWTSNMPRPITIMRWNVQEYA